MERGRAFLLRLQRRGSGPLANARPTISSLYRERRTWNWFNAPVTAPLVGCGRDRSQPTESETIEGGPVFIAKRCRFSPNVRLAFLPPKEGYGWVEFSLSSGRCVGNCYRNGLGKVKFKITTPPVSVTFCGYGFGPRVHRPPREFSLSFGDDGAELAACVTHACKKEIL